MTIKTELMNTVLKADGVRTMRCSSRIGKILPAMIMLSSIMGCMTFHAPFNKKMPKATAADPVVEIVCLWQPGEGSDPDGMPCKGFMGQVLFLSRSSSTPVQVEGEVRIYLFDDQGTEEEQAKPLRVFKFDNGSWGIHLSDSSFGPTYQVFVPYVRRGVPNANCSMRLRLKPKQGPVVFSEFTNMSLTGHKKTLRGDEAKPINQEEVDRLAAEAMSNELRRTTTISLAPNQKAKEIPAVVNQESTAGHIQLTAYETEQQPVPQNPDAERIRQLEAMVQQLLEQKNKTAVQQSDPPSVRIPVNKNRPDSQPIEEPSSRERFKMSPQWKVRHEEIEKRPPSPPRRLKHPLDDDQSESDGRPSHNDSTDGDSSRSPSDEPTDSSINASPRFKLQNQRN